MSNAERFFTPKSLARVAEAVEWEEVVAFYKDGTSNQSEYMRAMAILWERWMREWAIGDFAQSIHDVGSREYVTLLVRLLDTVETRVQQLVGFFQGLWAGANPGWSKKGIFTWTPQAQPWDGDSAARAILGAFIRHLQTIVEDSPGKKGG